MGDLIPGYGIKVMFMVKGDHRVFCKSHAAAFHETYEVEVSELTSCWACLREIIRTRGYD